MDGIWENKKVFIFDELTQSAMVTEMKRKIDFTAELEESYNLSPDSIPFFREKGYVKLKRVLTPALLNYFSDVVTDWVFRLNKLTKPMEVRAGSNLSAQPRKVMTVIYMDKNIRIVEPTNQYRIADWKTWLDSRPFGSFAEGSLNPVLYRNT